jgi:hypothetical protein
MRRWPDASKNGAETGSTLADFLAPFVWCPGDIAVSPSEYTPARREGVGHDSSESHSLVPPASGTCARLLACLWVSRFMRRSTIIPKASRPLKLLSLGINKKVACAGAQTIAQAESTQGRIDENEP